LKFEGEVFLTDDVAEQAGKVVSEFLTVDAIGTHAIRHLTHGLQVTQVVIVSKAILNHRHFQPVAHGVQDGSVDGDVG
jgi:hypothetical protein